MPGIDAWVFAGLCAASLFTTYFSVVTGTAGGLMLLAILSMVFPPAVLVPVHTMVQLGVGISRTAIMWPYIMRATILPFACGTVLGAVAGAQIFVTLPTAALQGILGGFIALVVWMPAIGRAGPERGRFAILGFAATFLGIFVSATGTLVGPFVASASPDRRNHSATIGILMTIVHIAKIIAFGALGVSLGTYLPLVGAMIVTAALGNWTGRMTLDHVAERWFRIGFKVLMTALAARLLWTALRDSGLF
jgi:uncharacterized membrane protein YfcA